MGMRCSLGLLFCASQFALTGCGLSAANYSGKPIDVALEACIDYVSETAAPDAIARGLVTSGWKLDPIDQSERSNSSEQGARFGEYQIAYYPLRNGPTRYSCYIGVAAENESQATVIVNAVKLRTGITDNVVINNSEFGHASIRRNRFDPGPRVKVHVNFDKVK